MSKRARRLWFGDWQHDDEETTPAQPVAADQADTVSIAPVDDGDAKWQAERRRRLRRNAGILAAVAVLFALGFALSSGGNDNQLTSARTQAPRVQPQLPQTQIPQVPQGVPPQGFGGADLTGPEATKAAAAAVAKYPGDVERVTRGPAGGGYVVHVFQSDGNEVHVLVDDGFHVRGSDAGSGAGNFGSGTPG